MNRHPAVFGPLIFSRRCPWQPIWQIQDRLRISYRLRVHEDAWYVVEQQLYCDVIDGQIQRMDVLCSGLLPSHDD